MLEIGTLLVAAGALAAAALLRAVDPEGDGWRTTAAVGAVLAALASAIGLFIGERLILAAAWMGVAAAAAAVTGWLPKLPGRGGMVVAGTLAFATWMLLGVEVARAVEGSALAPTLAIWAAAAAAGAPLAAELSIERDEMVPEWPLRLWLIACAAALLADVSMLVRGGEELLGEGGALSAGAAGPWASAAILLGTVLPAGCAAGALRLRALRRASLTRAVVDLGLVWALAGTAARGHLLGLGVPL